VRGPLVRERLRQLRDPTLAPPIRYGALDIEMLVLDAVEASLEVTHPWLISAH